MSERVSMVMQQFLRIRPHEMQRTMLAASYLFAAIGAFIVSRIARAVLFLEIPEYRALLPFTYIGSATAVSLTMVVYARYERRLRRDQTNSRTLIGIVLGFAAFRWALAYGNELTYWLFFFWVEVTGTFLVVQFWSFTNEIFTSRQAKRLFAVIGGGGVVANIAFGIGVRSSVKVLGTENLVFVIVGCLLVCMVLVRRLGRLARGELTAALERSSEAKGQPPPAGKIGRAKVVGGAGSTTAGAQRRQHMRGIFATRHVQLIAVVIVLTYLVSTMVDYQFNVIIADAVTGKDDRSHYFATFFVITGVLGAIVQFTATSRILERFGVLVGLLMLPASMWIGSGVLLTAPALMSGLWAVSLTKGAENVLRYTVNDATVQLMYLPVPGRLRGRAKTIIDGIFRPVAQAVSGFVLALLFGGLAFAQQWSFVPKLSVIDLSWLVGALLLVWMVALLVLRREYVKSLAKTLHQRRLNFADASFEIKDEATVNSLSASLRNGQEMGEVLQVLELLPYVAASARDVLDADVVHLLRHEEESVRVAALGYLRDRQPLHEADIGNLLRDPAVRVRAAAALTTCAVHHEAAIGRVGHLLEDPILDVRAATVAGLVRDGGLDGVLRCAEVLKAMLASESAEEKRAAAWILGEVGVKNFFKPLLPLLEDADADVRRAAVTAAGRLKSDALVPALARLCGDEAVGADAATALSGYGETVEEVVLRLTADVSVGSAARSRGCWILGRLGSMQARRTLELLLQDGDYLVREAAVTALLQLRRSRPGSMLEPAALAAARRLEAREYYGWLAMELDLQLADGAVTEADSDAALLADAMRRRREQTERRLFSLLAASYVPETVDLVRRNIHSSQPMVRSNAVEVLDNLLASEEKPYLIPIFEDGDARRKLKAAAPLMPLPSLTREERLQACLTGGDTWLQASAAAAARGWELLSLAPLIKEMLRSEHGVCRQTAVYALRGLLDPAEFAPTVAPLRDDADPLVARYVAAALG